MHRVITLLILTVVAVLTTSPIEAFTVEFTADQISVRGVSPGGTIAWNAVLVEPYNNAVLRAPSRGIAADEDRDGVVRFRPERKVPQSSVWAIVDLMTGEYSIVSPLPELIVEFSLDSSVRAGATPALSRGWITALIARPGVGAWVAEIREGGARDADGALDARLTVNPESFQPLLPGTGLPQGLRNDDVIIILDWETLEHAVARIAG